MLSPRPRHEAKNIVPGYNRQYLLARLPEGRLTTDHFTLVERPIPVAGAGEVLLRALYIPLDAANRAWMMGTTYRAALKAGDVMAGGALCEVVDANGTALQVGDLILSDTGWQEYATRPASALRPVPRREPLSHHLSIYGTAGRTAWIGVHRIGKVGAGETFVVSAAAGSIGLLAGQIAKAEGCHVVGIAGGAAKCDILVHDFGFDAAVDYKASDFTARLRDACPKGIDVFFDNVGGDVFETCLLRMAERGRIVCCGAVSQYDSQVPQHGPRGVPGLLVTRRLSAQGFVILDFENERDAVTAHLEELVTNGKIRVAEDVIEGFTSLPQALVGLLAGKNIGKRMVHVT